jgi:hypothetical protein
MGAWIVLFSQKKLLCYTTVHCILYLTKNIESFIIPTTVIGYLSNHCKQVSQINGLCELSWSS